MEQGIPFVCKDSELEMESPFYCSTRKYSEQISCEQPLVAEGRYIDSDDFTLW